MQREIKVVVAINDDDHADSIRQDIIRVVKSRTTIYKVSEPSPEVSDGYAEDRTD